MAVAKLTVSDLMKQEAHEPIWVLNTSVGDRRGLIYFGVPKIGGQGTDAVEVHSTFVPICLTDKVTRKQLLESADFRRAISKGMLTIIAEESATEKLQEPGADKEVERVRQLDINSASSEAQSGLGAEHNQKQRAQEENVSNPVQQMVALIDTNTDIEAMNALKSMGRLNLQDYRFVLRKAKEIRFDNLGRYCIQQIADIKASSADDE